MQQSPKVPDSELQSKNWVTRPNDVALRQANVNLNTGLATDFLNLFNEYIMLAELVCDGSMGHEVLENWVPIDYETHFARSGFAQAQTVLAAYRSLETSARLGFENEVATLISLILTHQGTLECPEGKLIEIKHQRDCVAALISEPMPANICEIENAQSAIDALFD
ncbi:MAG: hypothetical protein L3J13_05510 [Devosiaceae bacterium]|nr:hypothetical protein [Devosiaceae bacterium]